MEVSVIIPVYNAVPYVAQAVHSALDQPQTAEVLLVEDGCPDADSLPTCQRLAEADGRVCLLRHPNGENRGAAASRNLGIEKAQCDHLAFLDADDFYLPGRFTVAEQVFAGDSSTEVVYEKTGTHFETEEARQAWQDREGRLETSLEPGIPAEDIFASMEPAGKRGHCHLDALTMHRNLIQKTGVFPLLPVGQDTAFLMKLAACARWLPGQLDKPVAMRRIHSENRVTGASRVGKSWPKSGGAHWRARMQIWLSVFRWLNRQEGQDARLPLIFRGIRTDSGNWLAVERNPLKRSAILPYCLMHLLLQEPGLLKHALFMRGFARDIISRRRPLVAAGQD